MTEQQPLDEHSLSHMATVLIERHHPFHVMLAVWRAARSRRRQRRREAEDIRYLNISNRMRRDMGLPETDERLPGAPLDIFNTKF